MSPLSRLEPGSRLEPAPACLAAPDWTGDGLFVAGGEADGVSAVPAWLLPALLAGLAGLPGLAAGVPAPCFADSVWDLWEPVTLRAGG